MENNEIQKVPIKNPTCYYFHDMFKLDDFDLDNILLHEESHKNNLIYDISCKNLIDLKPFQIRFNKIDGFMRLYDRRRHLTWFGSKNMMLFTTELDIL